MFTINLICIGKLKESYLRDACKEYEKRISAYGKLNIIELSESKLRDNPSNADITRCIEIEGEAILAKAKGTLISLCIEGKMLSSTELADYFDKAKQTTSEVSLIIGGSYGLSDKVKRQSVLALSMSPMTFPHQLARVMLLEQLYRSFQISSGGKYHK